MVVGLLTLVEVSCGGCSGVSMVLYGCTFPFLDTDGRVVVVVEVLISSAGVGGQDFFTYPIGVLCSGGGASLCRVPGRGQVWAGRCVGLAGARFHSTASLAASSTPDPENRGEQGRVASRFHKDLVPGPRAGKQIKRPQTQQEEVDRVMAAMQGLFSMKGQDAMEVLISCLPSPVSSTDVLYNLQNLFRKHHEGLGFCYLSLELISNYQRRFRNESARFSGHPNRIYYLAEKIQVPVELFTERIGKPHKTLTMNIERLDSFIDMLHRYGITPEDIIADLWVFGYCSTRAEDRLRRAAELGCTDLRPWMCRCSDKIFDRFCARYQSGRDLLGEHESVFDFLSERLNCDRSEVERAFQSNIIMQRVHISKFNRILDLLFSEGIPATEIRMCMRIFQYSELRTAARIQELKNVGFFPFPLSILCRTPAQFRSMVQEFKKRKYMDVLQWNGK